MPTLTTIRTAAIAIASFIVLAIVSALISANVRRLASERGWDAFLIWAWNAAPAGLRNILFRLGPLRQLWWLWLSLGLSAGLGISLWLTSAQPAATIADTAQLEAAKELFSHQLADKDAEVATARQQLAMARQQLAALQPSSQSSPAQPKRTLSADRKQILNKIGILKNFESDYIIGFVNAYNDWSALFPKWYEKIKDDRQSFSSQLSHISNELRSASEKLEKYRLNYIDFDDIYKMLEQPKTSSVLKQIDDFLLVIKQLPVSLPPNYDVGLNEYMSELDHEFGAMGDWMTATRQTSKQKISELTKEIQ